MKYLKFSTINLAVILILVVGCKGRNIPDVSNIKVELQVQRFENDFFAIDTMHIDSSMQNLQQKYPLFTRDFVFNILALPAQPDSAIVVQKNITTFISSYKSLKNSSDVIFGDMKPIENEVKKGLQFVKFYFPEYKLPTKLVTFVGPDRKSVV